MDVELDDVSLSESGLGMYGREREKSRQSIESGLFMIRQPGDGHFSSDSSDEDGA